MDGIQSRCCLTILVDYFQFYLYEGLTRLDNNFSSSGESCDCGLKKMSATCKYPNKKTSSKWHEIEQQKPPERTFFD
jgi:hypothetical protein